MPFTAKPCAHIRATHLAFVLHSFRGVEKAFQRFYKGENIKTSVGYTGGADSSPDYKKVIDRVSILHVFVRLAAEHLLIAPTSLWTRPFEHIGLHGINQAC